MISKNKYTKIINVGMNGSGDDTTLSGSDYLDYINSHNLWYKVGVFSSRITTDSILGKIFKGIHLLVLFQS